MAETAYIPRLKQQYQDVLRGELVKEFGYENPMQVPRLDKVVLNIGVGEGVADSKKVTAAAADLALIAGQKPVITKARKSIATFKLREGMPIGAKVTLRQNRMYEFVDRLVNIALPRVRDFRGLNPEELRRPGQFHPWTEGAHHFPGDQFRQGRGDLGHGHRCMHHGADRRRGACVAEAFELSVPQLGLGGLMLR